MIDKEKRRRALDHIATLELTLNNSRSHLEKAQRAYLKSLGFTRKEGIHLDYYIYQDRTCHGINNALEYANEYI